MVSRQVLIKRVLVKVIQLIITLRARKMTCSHNCQSTQNAVMAHMLLIPTRRLHPNRTA